MAQIALPRDVASAVIVRGLAAAQRAIVIAVVLVVIVAVVEALTERGGTAAILPAVTPLVVIAGLALMLLVRPTAATATAYIVLGSAASVAYVVAVLSAEARMDVPGPYLVNRIATGLGMVGALNGSARSGIVWSVAGFVAAEASLVIGFSIVGQPVDSGLSPLIVLFLATIAYTVLAVGRSRVRRRIPDLDRLQLELELADRQRELERRAARVVHDTVLADLAIIAARPGELDPGARARLERDLAIAAEASVARLAEPAVVTPRAGIAHDLLELAGEYQWSGVTVDVSGWESLDVEVSSRVRDAVLGATRAALDNVVQHADTDCAELVVGSRDGRLAVLVVDGGVGFAATGVEPDRLGVRSSIAARIEDAGGAVRVWSGDEGTTVMLTVPVVRSGSAVAGERS